MLKPFSLELDPYSRSPLLCDLDPWYYPVKVNGELIKLGLGTTSSHDYLLAWQTYRAGVLGDSLLDQLVLEDKTMRDYASNCGYWALGAAQRGLQSYHGIEGREVFIDQGIQLWEAHAQSTAWSFTHSNVAELGPLPSVDISLCIGILYHLPDWQKVLRYVCDNTDEAIVVETRISAAGMQRKYPGDLMFNRIADVGEGLVELPALSEVTEILKEHGWGCVEVLINKETPESLIPDSEKFNQGAIGRVALIARK